MNELLSVLARANKGFSHFASPSGLVIAAPAPRIFETALGVLALQAADPDAPEVLSARRWLMSAEIQTHDPLAAVADNFLRSVALGAAPPLDLSAAVSTLQKHPSRGILLAAVAKMAGAPLCAVSDKFARTEALAARLGRQAPEEKPWTRAEIGAAFLLLCDNTHDLSIPIALHELTRAQGEEGSFFKNPVTTAVAVMALARYRVKAKDTLDRAVAWLRAANEGDGTWRFCTTEVWDTAIAVRVTRNSDPRSVDALLATQNDDGGFPYAVGVDSDTDTTAMAYIALARAGALERLRLDPIRYLLERQTPDGLWRTWHSAADEPAPDAVAHAVTALRIGGVDPRITEQARRWLEGQFRRGAGWQAHWYVGAPYAMHEIGLALGFEHPLCREAMMLLLRDQRRDGGFSFGAGPSEPSATGMALACLMRFLPADHPSMGASLHFLVNALRKDGLYTGATGMFGPRPFLSDYPAQTHAFAAFGLGELVARLKKTRSLDRRQSETAAIVAA